MVIWHFGERKIRKHKEVNEGQSFKIDSKCQREKHLQRRITDAVLMLLYSMKSRFSLRPSHLSFLCRLQSCSAFTVSSWGNHGDFLFLSTIFFLSLSCVSVCRCFNYLQSSSAEPITLPLHSSPLLSRVCGWCCLSVCTEATYLNEALLDLIDTSQGEESPPLPPRPWENT